MNKVKSIFFLNLVGILLFSLGSCQKREITAQALTPLESRGKGVYISNCISCHNPDPSLDGSIGPALAGSSLTLITHRILTRDYPPAYSPKRSSMIMPSFPQLKDDLPSLHAYLNSFKK